MFWHPAPLGLAPPRVLWPYSSSYKQWEAAQIWMAAVVGLAPDSIQNGFQTAKYGGTSNCGDNWNGVGLLNGMLQSGSGFNSTVRLANPLANIRGDDQPRPVGGALQ